jgi:hypothetical protein
VSVVHSGGGEAPDGCDAYGLVKGMPIDVDGRNSCSVDVDVLLTNRVQGPRLNTAGCSLGNPGQPPSISLPFLVPPQPLHSAGMICHPIGLT